MVPVSAPLGSDYRSNDASRVSLPEWLAEMLGRSLRPSCGVALSATVRDWLLPASQSWDTNEAIVFATDSANRDSKTTHPLVGSLATLIRR